MGNEGREREKETTGNSASPESKCPSPSPRLQSKNQRRRIGRKSMKKADPRAKTGFGRVWDLEMRYKFHPPALKHHWAREQCGSSAR